MLDKKLAKNIDFLLLGRFNISFKDCNYFNGYEYIKIFYEKYCIYYNKKTDHIERIFNIDYHIQKKKNLYK